MQLTAPATQGSLFAADPMQTAQTIPAAAPSAQTAAAAANALAILAGGVAAQMRPELDAQLEAMRAELTAAAEAAKKAAAEAAEAAARPPQIIQQTITIAGRKPHTLPAGETLHPAFEIVLSAIQCGETPYLHGPAGSGKTHLCAQIARALYGDKARFAALSCNAQTTQGDIFGRLLPMKDKQGNTTIDFRPNPFTEIYTQGGVFLFDEFDAASAEAAIVINQALANGEATLPNGETIRRHKDAVILCAGNTYGDGADQDFTARSALDAATLDRFCFCEVNYDTDLEEKTILAGLPKKDAETIRRARDIARAVIDERHISRIFFSMRAVRRYAAFIHNMPKTDRAGRKTGGTIDTTKDILEHFAMRLGDEDRRAILARA